VRNRENRAKVIEIQSKLVALGSSSRSDYS
jgi:hypothetical protein